MKFAWFETSILLAAVLAVAGVWSGCSGQHDKPVYQFLPDMMDSFAVKAQKLGPFGEPMRVPPDGTVSQTSQPYHYANDPEGAGKNLHNPLPRTKQVLMRGQHIFNTYCIVCHGPRGEGNGYIVPKFPQPPSLQSDKVRNWPDGRIFHVITMGQNLMPSYASQISIMDRWAVIQYVRVIQRAMHPTAADLKEMGK